MDDFNHFAIKGFDFYAEEYAVRFKEPGAFNSVISRFISLLPENGNLIDLGCGPGNVLKFIHDAKPNIELKGVDLSPKMLDIARLTLPTAQFELNDVREVSFEDKYDGVLLSFCTPYLNEKEVNDLISKASMGLQKNGLLYLSTMEGSYDDSGWISSSKNPELKSYTYFYSEDFLRNVLEVNNIETIYLERIGIPNNRTKATNDLVLIGRII